MAPMVSMALGPLGPFGPVGKICAFFAAPRGPEWEPEGDLSIFYNLSGHFVP